MPLNADSLLSHCWRSWSISGRSQQHSTSLLLCFVDHVCPLSSQSQDGMAHRWHFTGVPISLAALGQRFGIDLHRLGVLKIINGACKSPRRMTAVGWCSWTASMMWPNCPCGSPQNRIAVTRYHLAEPISALRIQHYASHQSRFHKPPPVDPTRQGGRPPMCRVVGLRPPKQKRS